MPADAYDDAIDLQIGLLSAGDPTAKSYPYPSLSALGDQEMRRFRTVVLQNAYLTVTILPGLGGRMISIFDKRTGKEILPRSQTLLPQPGGSRGVSLADGLQIQVGVEDRLNSMGNVDTALERPMDDESPAGVWISETVGGTGISWQAHVHLPADRAELLIETRVLNRTRLPVAYRGGISIGIGNGCVRGNTVYVESLDTGFSLYSTEPPFSLPSLQGDRLRFDRDLVESVLGPRQVDYWSVRLNPWSGLGGDPVAGDQVAILVSENALSIQTSRVFLGAKLMVQTTGGRVLESPADLYPERITAIPLGEFTGQIAAVAVQDAAKKVLVLSEVTTASPQPDEVWNLSMAMGTRHLAYLLLAERALAQDNLAEADEKLEQALLYNGDDPLMWWLKALVGRLSGAAEEGQTELLNAHYLAPLEPALRAEAFLAQSQEMGKEPNPLLGALEENPENFIEVAAMLTETGRWDQASRWIDEAIRHKDMPMLRYLWAYAYLMGSRMEVQAAEQLNEAAKLEFGPPFPFRAVEIRALRFLTERFPTDLRLAQYVELLSQVGRLQG